MNVKQNTVGYQYDVESGMGNVNYRVASILHSVVEYGCIRLQLYALEGTKSLDENLKIIFLSTLRIISPAKHIFNGHGAWKNFSKIDTSIEKQIQMSVSFVRQIFSLHVFPW